MRIILKGNEAEKITLFFDELTDKERLIIAEGCLINYYKKGIKDRGPIMINKVGRDTR